MFEKPEEVSTALEVVFDQSSDFIVIGFTGRTGSGCSTSAALLSQEKLPLPDVGSSHFKGNEARKYRIIKNYIDKKWQAFEWLQIRAVITGYLLELNFSEFMNLVSGILKEDLDVVKSKIYYFKDEYDIFHLKIKKYIEGGESTIETEGSNLVSSYNLYFKELKDFSDEIREALKKISLGAYTTVYQRLGDNIRSSGRADRSEFNPEKIFNFSETINGIIKSARHNARNKKTKCYIIIDAIRNPYEAVYFRERYAGFFLVSINTDNSNRLAHLRKSHKFTDVQIKNLDEKEYPKRLVGEKKFISQNIQKCIEISDIHINNPRKDQFGTSELASQLAWYVSLMTHPGLVMPTSTESCMQIAYSVKQNSGCISRQVGAIVTDEFYSVKAVGWNNTPQGQVPCLLRSAGHLIDGIDSDAYSFYERNDEGFRGAVEEKYTRLIAKSIDKGRNLAYCFKDIQNEVENEKNQVHTRSLHAEENAFLQISKYGGQKIKGGILFTTASPCELCAKKAYQLGISRIVYIDPYPGIATSHILASGDNCPELSLFRGAIGIAFHRLYQPIMPYKDELEMLLTVPKKENKKDMQIKRLKDENSSLKDRIATLENRFNEKPSSLEETGHSGDSMPDPAI
ncbi:anti-phage dCTP deaminase [Marinobacterium sedimentorum]|uniref:anti-phage dCTP deaminase n=1 Tax=Marinobacterium sedimentorum TaxID=2927804 RepID=UPI0020C70923|nr:anti-phage dCTP deaminase [Marinobacterium sedimentorum]MCP8690413.1 deoxycytidylate deaminase [Marinobacterium sedimentorum]